MAAELKAFPLFRVMKQDGTPAAGWKVHTYEPGSTVDKTTWTDYTKGTANSNPVILNDRGEAAIAFDGIYRIYVTDENNNPISGLDIDNFGAGSEVTTTDDASLIDNGSFENDSDGDGIPDGWDVVEYPDGGSGAGVQSLDATDFNHGSQSIKFVSLGDGGGYATTTNFFSVSPDTQLRVFFQIKSSVVDVRNVVDVIFYDEDDLLVDTINVYDNSTTNPTTWTPYVFGAIPPATSAKAKFRLYGCHSSDPTAGTTWFDGCRIDEHWNQTINQLTINGGTSGDLLYVNSSGVLVSLAVGGQGRVLTAINDQPVWGATDSGGKLYLYNNFR